MTTITTRAGKNSPLSNVEVDGNFTNLNTAKLELGQAQSSGTANGVLYLNGSKAVTSGSALTFDGTNLATTGIARASSFLASNTNGITLSDDVAGGFLSYGYNSGRTNVASHVWYNGITSEQMRLASTGLTVQQGAVFNESGADSDFRVESDASTHALFVDAGNDRVAVGSSGPTQKFQVYSGSGTATKMYVQSDLNFAGLYAGTGANNRGAAVEFVAHTNVIDSTGFKIFSESDVVSRALVFSYAADASPYGALSYTERMRIDGPTELVINDPGNDYDFRVESDTNTHALFVDAGTSKVGINTSTAYGTLTVWQDSTPDLVFRDNTGNGSPRTIAGIGYETSGLGGTPKYAMTIDIGSYNDIFYTKLYSNGGGYGQVERLTLYDGSAVFNEGGLDYDFRVESDNSTHALFVDAGNSRVGIQNDSPVAVLDVSAYDVGTDPASATYLSRINIRNTAVSFAGNGGALTFQSGTGTNPIYASVIGWMQGSAAGGAFGDLVIATKPDYATANPVERARFKYTTEAVFNDGGLDYDFRVESDTNTHMLFVDAGNNSVGIASSTPGASGNLVINNTDNTRQALYIGAVTGNVSGAVGSQVHIRDTTAAIGTNGFAGVTFSSSPGIDYVLGKRWNGASSFVIRDGTATNDYLTITAGSEVVVNDSSADVDFRVESDTNTHALFVDAGTSRVGVNLSNPNVPLHVYVGTSNSTALQLSGLSGYTAGVGPRLVFQNGTSTGEELAGVQGSFDVDVNGNYGRLSFFTRTSDALGIEEKMRVGFNGALTTLPITNGHAVFNEGGVDADFRVESDTNTHAFFVDAGNSSVSIGTSTPGPASSLTVTGIIRPNLGIVSVNQIMGFVAGNYTGTRYWVLHDMTGNPQTAFNCMGDVHAASYTTWNLSNLWIRREYNTYNVYGGITGVTKNATTVSIVDITYNSSRYVAIKFAGGDPAIEANLVGYLMNQQYNGNDPTFINGTAGVTENAVVATY